MRPAPPLRGFTLVEMLIVLAVLAALASLAWPAVRGMAAKSELRSAAGNVRSCAGPSAAPGHRVRCPATLPFPAWDRPLRGSKLRDIG